MAKLRELFYSSQVMSNTGRPMARFPPTSMRRSLSACAFHS